MAKQPKWFNQEKSIKKKANEKEERLYKHFLSGALSWKGDFSDDTTCIDLKSTKHKSIRVTTEMLDKLQKDSLEMGKPDSILVLELPKYYVMCKVIRKADME